MTGHGLGVRQRRMLTNLAVFGAGRWPTPWRPRADDRTVLSSLSAKGLVSPHSRPQAARLTDEGHRIAALLMSDAQRELAVTLTAKRRAGLL